MSVGVPRIHCDLKLGPGAQFALEADAAQHVAKSLRLKAGDSIVVFDGRGGEYEASLTRVERERVDVKVGPIREPGRESPLEIGLVQGVPEADKMDWIIQKATELGVGWIQPLTCERSVVRLSAERASRREAHWRRVAIAAAEQSGRTRIPEVRPTLAFMSWVAPPSPIPRWMLDPSAQSISAQPAVTGPLELLVGPEGGFAERERELLASRGAIGVSLGPRVLRTETAAIVAMSAIHALWGDFRPVATPDS